MLSKVLVVAGLGAAGWFYVIDGSKLDEAMVRDFYEKQQIGFLSRNPEALCKQFASNVVINSETVILGQKQVQTLNQKTACEATHDSFKSFTDIGGKTGGILMMDYQYKIDSIEIAANKKRATVVTSNILTMGGSLMEFRTTSNEELVRNYREVQLVKSDSKTGMDMNLAGMADPAKFFGKQ